MCRFFWSCWRRTIKVNCPTIWLSAVGKNWKGCQATKCNLIYLHNSIQMVKHFSCIAYAQMWVYTRYKHIQYWDLLLIPRHKAFNATQLILFIIHHINLQLIKQIITPSHITCINYSGHCNTKCQLSRNEFFFFFCLLQHTCLLCKSLVLCSP